MKKPQKQRQAAPEPQEPLSAMNAYARRIWDGQSCSLPLRHRVERIVAALQDQGMGDELGELSLPAAGYERFVP